MEGFIKLSTAHTFQLGPFLDDTDGRTAETGLTIGDTDCFLSKNGGAAAAKNDTTDLTGTGDTRGYYDCVLNTTDTNTVGTLKVMVHVSGALPVWATFQVVPAIIFDALFNTAGTDYLPVDVVQSGGSAAAAGAIPNAAAGASGGLPTVDSANAVKLQSGTAPNQISLSSGLVTLAGVTHTGAVIPTVTAVNGFGANAITAAAINAGAITNAKFAAGAIDAAAIADNAIDIATFASDVKTGSYLNAQVKGEDNIDFGSTQKTSIQTAANAALVAQNLDHLLAVAAVAGDAVDSSIIARLVSKSATPAFSSFDNTTDSLEASRDNVGAAGANLTVAAVTGAVGSVTGSVGSVTGSVGSVTGAVGSVTGAVGSVTGAVGSVTGNVSGNVTGSVGSVASGGITSGSFAAGAINAAAIADAAIDNATFAADVSTGGNRIATAVYNALDTAFTDASGLTANGLLERIRVLGWILRNKIEVTDANGNTVIYKDDSTTTGFSVNGMLTDNSTTTTRLRAA